MSISRVLGDAALKAQRLQRIHAYLPPVVRRRLSAAASGLIAHPAGDLVDDWSRPLVAATGQVAAPGAAELPDELPHPHAIDLDLARIDLQPDAPRCLLASSSLDVGGMDEVVAFLALRLRFYGLRTAVLHTGADLAPDVKGRLARMLSAAGVEVAVEREAGARRWIREWAPDVISAHEAPDWVLDEARTTSVPYVEVLHGMHSLFDRDWTAEAARGHNIAAIVAVSDLVRRQYLRGVPTFPSDRIVTIPNGVDDQRRTRHDRSAARAALGLHDEFLFVCLARQCLQKNQFGVVSAFDEVAARYRNAHLLIAGRVEEPIYCTQVRQVWERLAARDRVHVRDHAPDPALVLSAADGFVLDSFFEGWPLASMEALHAGVPVIASDVGGTREQLGTDPSRGYLIRNPFGDPLQVNWTTIRSVCYARQTNREELVEAMCALVRERKERADGREQLAAESAERFHPAHCLRAHADLLRSCISGDIFTCSQAA